VRSVPLNFSNLKISCILPNGLKDDTMKALNQFLNEAVEKSFIEDRNQSSIGRRVNKSVEDGIYVFQLEK